MNTLDLIALFILLAGIFIYINLYHLKLPSSVGLIILSLTLSFCLLIYGIIVPEFIDNVIRIMDELDYQSVLLEIVLSFLLFAGAINVDFKKMGSSKTPTIILAIVGVIISIFLIGWSIHSILGWGRLGHSPLPGIWSTDISYRPCSCDFYYSKI